MRRRLKPHPATFGPPIRIGVETVRCSGGLDIHYLVTGDIAAVALAPAGAPARGDRLWEHSCFEAFIRAEDELGYFELNFAPSHIWAAYQFDSYREGMRAAEIVAPRIGTRAGAGGYELSVSVDLPDGKLWHIGLSAVIEAKNGSKSYWALAHPPGPPDFHHETCFALELPAAGGP